MNGFHSFIYFKFFFLESSSSLDVCVTQYFIWIEHKPINLCGYLQSNQNYLTENYTWMIKIKLAAAPAAAAFKQTSKIRKHTKHINLKGFFTGDVNTEYLYLFIYKLLVFIIQANLYTHKMCTHWTGSEQNCFTKILFYSHQICAQANQL